MAGGCCGGCEMTPPTEDQAWRRVLWIALAINAGMFAVEIVAGVAAHSAALKADALDFLGDAANYAIRHAGSIGRGGMRRAYFHRLSATLVCHSRRRSELARGPVDGGISGPDERGAAMNANLSAKHKAGGILNQS